MNEYAFIIYKLILLYILCMLCSGGDIITDVNVTPYNNPRSSGNESDLLPMSIGLTEFHIALLYSSNLVMQSYINNEVQQDISMRVATNYGEDSVVKIIRDPVKRIVYVITTTGYVEVNEITYFTQCTSM
jgi:hypothetical protein